MIAATYKFQNFYGSHYTREGFIGALFYRSNPYPNRLKIAEKEIKNRKN